MKSIFQNILACTMALVVVFSTMSFTIDMHYCGDTLVDLAINKEAKTCNMEMSQNKTLQFSKNNNGCCNDQQLSVDGQDELKLNTADHLKFDQHTFVTTFLFAYVNLFEGLPEQIIPFKHYNPPLLITDIQVVNESFLI